MEVLPSLLAAQLSPEDQENPVGQVDLHYFSVKKNSFSILTLLCSYHNSWVSLLTGCSDFSRGTLLQTGNGVMGGTLLAGSTVSYLPILTMFPLEP